MQHVRKILEKKQLKRAQNARLRTKEEIEAKVNNIKHIVTVTTNTDTSINTEVKADTSNKESKTAVINVVIDTEQSETKEDEINLIKEDEETDKVLTKKEKRRILRKKKDIENG